MEVVPCLLLCIPLYFAFRVDRSVRPYTARTHVRRKKGKFWHIAVVFCQAVWYTQASEHTDQIITKRCVIMGYGWATVFTLAAWFAGSVLDAILGDLGLRTVFSIIVMGCCIMKYIKTRRVWGRHAPTGPRLCSNERPSGAFEQQPGLAPARWRGLAPTGTTSKTRERCRSAVPEGRNI